MGLALFLASQSPVGSAVSDKSEMMSETKEEACMKCRSRYASDCNWKEIKTVHEFKQIRGPSDGPEEESSFDRMYPWARKQVIQDFLAGKYFLAVPVNDEEIKLENPCPRQSRIKFF